MPIGTFVNVLAIILGSLVGLLLHRNFSERFKDIVFQGIGLAVVLVGLDMALTYESIIVVVFSLALGGLTGEALRLERFFEKVGTWMKNAVRSKEGRFVDGLVTAFLIFCIGSMAIIGSIDDGVRGDRTVLYTKSILDGFIAIPLASTFGSGVIFSFLPVLLYQGGITILAHQSQSFFTPAIISQITSVGGLLICGIGINLLELRRINVTNLLPALPYAIILTLCFG